MEKRIKDNILELYEIYSEKDKDIFIKIRDIFNSKVCTLNFIEISLEFKKSISKIMKLENFAVILLYDKYKKEIEEDDDLKTRLGEKFLEELKFCNTLISEIFFSSQIARDHPMTLYNLKLLSIKDDSATINLTRYDGENIIFKLDKKSVKGVISFLESVSGDLNKIEGE